MASRAALHVVHAPAAWGWPACDRVWEFLRQLPRASAGATLVRGDRRCPAFYGYCGARLLPPLDDREAVFVCWKRDNVAEWVRATGRAGVHVARSYVWRGGARRWFAAPPGREPAAVYGVPGLADLPAALAAHAAARGLVHVAWPPPGAPSVWAHLHMDDARPPLP
jgi:hypothetical protein